MSAWTTEKPMTAGKYWYRRTAKQSGEVVWIEGVAPDLYQSGRRTGICGETHISCVSGEWQPVEPAKE